MEPQKLRAAVRDLTDALFFLPGPAVDALILLVAVLAGIVVHFVLRLLLRRALAHQPFALSLVERVRVLSGLAFATIALGLVVPALDLSPVTVDWIEGALR